MNGSIDVSVDTLNNIRAYSNIELKENIKFTSIVILTYNQLEYTKLCIESIRIFTPKNSYEIIIVDNNSTDGTCDWLKEQTDLKVIFNSENLGFPKGCNVGIEIAIGENILLLNNDTIVTPDWLSNLNTALYSNENIGAVGAITNSCSNGQQVSVGYLNIDHVVNLSREIYRFHEGEWDYKTKLVGFCYMVKKSVLDKTGLLDPIFTPGNYEDDDLSLKIINAGYNLLLCKDTFIHHFGSVSFSKDVSAYSMCLTINRMKLNSKWGFDVNSKNYAKFDLIEMMKGSFKKEVNVLEVNCGIGVTLYEIKNRFKNANLYGLESNENIAKVSNAICNISVGDISDISTKYNENFFDYIILGDVLEHLIDPWKELRNISKCLKANGLIITAIPNINYIGVIKELIKGKFTYLSEGILNQDHLRFFTLEEINKLFNTSGYNITNIVKDETVISEEEENLISGLCELCGDSNKDEYKNIQYRITARKIIDKSRYDNENMVKLKYMIMRVDNGFEEKETFDKIFELYEGGYFARDLNYLISNNVINKGLVLAKIIGQIMSRGLNYILEDLEGLGYE